MNRSTTGQTNRRGDLSGNEQGASPLRLEAPRRRVQVPQLLVAVFLVAFSALVAVVLFSRAAAKEPVLALANAVTRGQVVAMDDLLVAYVASDDPIATVSSDDASSLVGLSAVADLPAGTILTSAHLISRTGLEDGEGVVGLALAPGEFPTLSLAPGDRVEVVATDGVDGTVSGRVISSAEVFDVAELGVQGDRFVSLRLPADLTAEVAAAAEADQVRLVLVAGADS